MSISVSIYKKNFLQRFDKDEAIPYLSSEDYPSLKKQTFSFITTKGDEVKYFIYNYDQYDSQKVVFFCPGIGPGHIAYMREIEYICSHGYQVYTLDYVGCGESSGNNLPSINEPTRDLLELLNLLKLDQEIILIGHSLGGYTALNVINKIDCIKTAVVISGFLSVKYEIKGLMKLDLLVDNIVKFEQKNDPEYAFINNIEYLKKTKDNLLFIHSEDDPMVAYSTSMKIVKEINNPNVVCVSMKDKKHNPNYTKESVDLMNKTINSYLDLKGRGKLKTLEERRNHFNNITAWMMTNQDEKIWQTIFDFIK